MVLEGHAIIGAGYGDEGKGLITHYKCRSIKKQLGRVINVRFNGGAQAGHTTYSEKTNTRHVFNTFGSGTMAGVKTHLSEFFLFDPLMFERERTTLREKNIPFQRPTISPLCYMVTFIDIILNQSAEILRGSNRHGSCGMGIGETVERSENSDYDFVVGNLAGDNKGHLLEILMDCWKNYLPERAEKLGVTSDKYEELEMKLFFEDKDYAHFMLSKWYDSAKQALRHITLVPDEQLEAEGVVFEGAQGLKLDMDNGTFPYVTRSNTGLTNVAKLCEKMNVGVLNTTYVSRTYKTRHGEGPMLHELEGPPSMQFADQTNKPNPYQGSLRFGLLDLDELMQDILADASKARTTVSVALTCCDQIPDGTFVVTNGKAEKMTAMEIAKKIGITKLMSYGPTVKDIKKVC